MADDRNTVLPSSPPEVVEAGTPEPILIRMPVDVRGLTLTVLVLLGAVLMLKYAQPVLIPIVVGVLLSYILAPGVNLLHRYHVPRVIGATLAIALLCGIIGLGVYTLTGQVMHIVDTVPQAARRFSERLDRRARQDEGALAKVQEAAREVEEAAAAASEPAAASKGVTRVQIVEPAFAARDYLWAGGVGLLGVGAQFAMVLFLVFFLLVTGDLFKRKLVKIAGPTLTRKKITVQIMDEINVQIGNFLLVQVATSTIVGIATAIALWWFGVNQYVVWGLLAGIFNSIPYLGPVIVTGGLAVVSFMQFDDLVKTLYVSGATLAITSLEGWLLTPALMGRAAQMNPVAIFVGLLFWSWVWGVWGTILAVPMLMMLKAICDRVDGLQPFGELLGE